MWFRREERNIALYGCETLCYAGSTTLTKTSQYSDTLGLLNTTWTHLQCVHPPRRCTVTVLLTPVRYTTSDTAKTKPQETICYNDDVLKYYLFNPTSFKHYRDKSTTDPWVSYPTAMSTNIKLFPAFSCYKRLWSSWNFFRNISVEISATRAQEI